MDSGCGLVYPAQQAFVFHNSPELSTARTRRRHGCWFGSTKITARPPFSALLLSLIPSDIDDPQVEAEILSDMSHVVWDVVPLLGGSTLMYRLSALLGRILQMESDYVPDQTIVADDLIFNLPLLGLSAVLFWRSFVPVIQASFTQPSYLDELVYEQLFEPVDVNWIQFRSMLATGCIDWVTLDAGTTLESEEETLTAQDDSVYLYWLYEGQVIGSYKGNLLTRIERRNGMSIDDPSATGLLADMKFLYSLDLKKEEQRRQESERWWRQIFQINKKKAKNAAPNDTLNGNASSTLRPKYPLATLRVGEIGATVMRIQSKKLFDLIEHDDHLASSIKQLLLKSLQRKVGLLLRSRIDTSITKQELHQFPRDERQVFDDELVSTLFEGVEETSLPSELM